MVYESTIAFTLDTICPWTYIAKRRLGIALEHVRFNDPPVKFKITYHPYLLHPDLPAEGEDKYQWYLHNKYNDSEENMKKYTTVLQALGVGCGVVFNFGGKIGPTIDAHRIIQYFQEKEGEDCADKIIDCEFTLLVFSSTLGLFSNSSACKNFVSMRKAYRD